MPSSPLNGTRINLKAAVREMALFFCEMQQSNIRSCSPYDFTNSQIPIPNVDNHLDKCEVVYGWSIRVTNNPKIKIREVT